MQDSSYGSSEKTSWTSTVEEKNEKRGWKKEHDVTAT